LPTCPYSQNGRDGDHTDKRRAETYSVKVLDFGLAKVTDKTPSGAFEQGAFLGCKRYKALLSGSTPSSGLYDTSIMDAMPADAGSLGGDE